MAVIRTSDVERYMATLDEDEQDRVYGLMNKFYKYLVLDRGIVCDLNLFKRAIDELQNVEVREDDDLPF